MKSRLIFLFKYFVFWIIFFETARLLFVLYNISYIDSIPFEEILKSFWKGLKLDISLTGYILMLASLLSVIFFFTSRFFKITLDIFTLTLIVVFTFIIVIDMELYGHWGFHIDSSVLLYIKTPKESLASTPVLKIILLLLIILLFIISFFMFYKKFVSVTINVNEKIKWFKAPLFLIFAALMIIPIRGGFGLAPINQGSVFFSRYQFVNHTAVNCIWNFGSSLLRMNEKENIKFMSDKKAEKIFNKLTKTENKQKALPIIKSEKPNIIVIILESFASWVIEPLGGIKGATPNLNNLSKQSVIFKNLYASGDRSDKGIVAILSGYPAQPTSSIIKYVNKTARLPFISKDLEANGYFTAFYYGGNIDFANMRSYLINGGFSKLVTLKDFDKKDLNSKWGAHDHVVFNKLFEDINKQSQPFFDVMFTLSSHEPYDVPHISKFKGHSEKQMFLNSVHYTDSCVGSFIEKAKKTTWWKNTWIILVADHGKSIEYEIPYYRPEKFKILMLWLGGAIKNNFTVSYTASQIDLPLMICNQLKMQGKSYKFSKDILAKGNHFAYYAYNNGFGFYTDSTGFVWDNTSKKIIVNNQVPEIIKDEGKAFLQILLKDFNSK